MWSGLVLGLLLGLRHALEPDHVFALSTLVMGSRGPRESARLGASWGLGHTVALALMGGSLVATETVLSARMSAGFELVVCGMLVLLGARAIARALKRHGERDPVHHPAAARTVRPLLVGLVHGLAGSGALAALVIAQLPSTGLRLAYIGVFGLGSIGGMALASLVVGMSMGTRRRRAWPSRALGLAVGALSVGVAIHCSLAPLADLEILSG